jgi:putative chitinase
VNVTLSQAQAIFPRAAAAWLLALIEEMPRWDIVGPDRVSAFLGQIGHESNGLTVLDEKLHYTDAERVRAIFGRHFDALDVDDAWGYLQQPERFANRVYAGRMGNGDEASGDGYRYRGRGPIMRTGRAAYQEDADALACDIITDPDLVARTPAVGCAVACRFFLVNRCNELADRGDIEGVSRKVNGGHIGLKERIHLTADALRVLAA